MALHRQPVVKLLDDLIAQLEQKPAKLRKARALIVEALSPQSDAAAPTAKKTIAPGSVPARILELLGETMRPVTSQELVTAAKVPYATLISHVSDLVDAGRVVVVGAGRNRRYELPKKKGGAK